MAYVRLIAPIADTTRPAAGRHQDNHHRHNWDLSSGPGHEIHRANLERGQQQRQAHAHTNTKQHELAGEILIIWSCLQESRGKTKYLVAAIIARQSRKLAAASAQTMGDNNEVRVDTCAETTAERLTVALDDRSHSVLRVRLQRHVGSF